MGAEGESMGSSTITTPFSGKEVKVDNSVTKINGLVNEYMGVVQNVKNRWPLGLGKYLIGKLEVAMQGIGALEVDKVADKSGNFVFMNAHAVGLSSRLGDFQTLAVRMSHYERTWASGAVVASSRPRVPSSSRLAVVAARGAQAPVRRTRTNSARTWASGAAVASSRPRVPSSSRLAVVAARGAQAPVRRTRTTI